MRIVGFFGDYKDGQYSVEGINSFTVGPIKNDFIAVYEDHAANMAQLK